MSPARNIAPNVKAPRRILVVDDNQPAANALQRILTHYSHQVEVAYSGTRALEAISAFNPEFIVLDIGMPEMDGHQVAEKIRTTDSEVKIIALSGYGQESDKVKSKEAGFDYHLVKPVRTQEILVLLDATVAAT